MHEPEIKEALWKISPFTSTNLSLVYQGTKVVLVASDLAKKDFHTFESKYLRTDILSLFTTDSEDYSLYNTYSEKKMEDKLKYIKDLSILATESKPFKYLLGIKTTFYRKLVEKEPGKFHVKEWKAMQQMLNEMFSLISERNFPSKNIPR